MTVFFLFLACFASVVWHVAEAAPICSLSSSARIAALPTSTQSFQSSQGSYASYAETAFTSFINHMYDSTNRKLRLSYDSASTSNYWNTAVALQGLLEYADFHQFHGILGQGWGETTVRNTVKDIVATQATLSGQCDSNLRNDFNDDMSWMAHALVKLWKATGLTTYITKAVLLFDTIKLSDDTSCCGSMNCGVWWNTAHEQKATAAQAGVTLAALMLRASGQANSYTQLQWLNYATDHYNCWKNNMVNTGNGQVCDHIKPDGSKIWWGFTYNNGLMLGAALQLYNQTATASYLTDAGLYADYLLNGQTVSVGGTNVKILNNDCGSCDNDCSQFHAVPMRYLADYYNILFKTIAANKATTTQAQLDRLCNIHAFMKNNVDAIWQYARDSSTGSFNCNWNAPFSTGGSGLQGSMNSAMAATSLFASLPIFMQ